MRRWSLLWHCYVWGGVSCSNGSDDDETSVRLKGNFFISEDEDAEWVYCEDKLTEKESGIWEGEITAVRGWDKFGVEVNGTWYGAEDGLADPETDAKLVKDSNKNFWLVTDKGGKSRVTVNLNKMTITVKNTATVDNDNTSGGNTETPGENDDNKETDGSGTTSGSESGDVENGDNTQTPDGSDDNENVDDNEETGGDNTETEIPTPNETLVKDFAYTANGDLIEVCPAKKLTNISPKSITISVANVAGTGDWWCSYDANGGDWTSIKENWDDSIKGYKKTITNSTEISYFKENGIKIGMLTGLTATVTVTWE